MQCKKIPTVIEPAKESTLPDSVLGPCFTLKGNATRPPAEFVRYRVRGNSKKSHDTSPLLMRTGVFASYNGPLRTVGEKGDEHITFALSETDSPNLFNTVKQIESEVERALCDEEIKGMSKETKQYILSRKEEGNLVRKHEPEKNIFFDLDKDCSCFEWDGSGKIGLDAMRGGKYQLVIQLSSIYLGLDSHQYGAYLQWKVVQVRYSPEEMPHYLTSMFLFDKEVLPAAVDEQCAVAAPPPAKKKKGVTTSTQT